MPDWRQERLRPLRFVFNGLLAAGVHVAVLQACIILLGMRSAGLANTVAALAGIGASFLGNRLLVFDAAGLPWQAQLARFWTLYLALSSLQGGIMFLWADVGGLDYRAGFLLGALIAALCAYLGGKHWVFRAPG